jgi:hypothetical protein
VNPLTPGGHFLVSDSCGQITYQQHHALIVFDFRRAFGVRSASARVQGPSLLKTSLGPRRRLRTACGQRKRHTVTPLVPDASIVGTITTIDEGERNGEPRR